MLITKDLDKGQHFLVDNEIIKKEVAFANISKKDRIIEIGAGGGNLTAELVKKADEVLAFEIDKRYAKKLESLKKKNKNLKIIYDDAFNYSWKNYTKIVSNIPYFISEQLINKAIKDETPEMTLIVGEKFKEKLSISQKSKIGIISNLFYDIEFALKVNKKCFSPQPRVNSWLIKLKKKEKFSDMESILISILRRSGKLKNAIIYSLVKKGWTKKESKRIIKDMNIQEQVLEKPISRITGKFLIRLAENLEKIK